MYFKFIKYRKIFYFISLSLVILSFVSFFVFGLKLGTDFTGGSVIKLSYVSKTPSENEIKDTLSQLNLKDISVQKIDSEIILRIKGSIDEKTHQEILNNLKKLGEIKEGSESFEVIGALIGKELKNKTKVVITLSLILILLYIAFSFRRVSRPVPSYVYGLTGILALSHDIIIPLGIFSVLGIEIDIPIITALLTVLGYSINDSVVVFDRIRENIIKLKDTDFGLTVEKALNQSFRRCLNTLITTLLALLTIFFFGGETLKNFSLALILGIGCGGYSSIFLASPLLVDYLLVRRKKV